MSSQFVKKLRKDLKKSPGKAAVLAVLFLVALWFWAPLLKNLAGGEATTPPPAASTSQVGISTPSSPGTTAPITQPQYTWKQITDAIEADPRMAPTAPATLERDPFHPIEETKPIAEPTEVVAAPPVAPDVPPADAGLVLNSTIVGSRRHVARVNGKSYRKGDTIAAAVGDNPLEYQLIAIDPRSVTLALGKRRYELKMRRAAATSTSASSVNLSSEELESLLMDSQQ